MTELFKNQLLHELSQAGFHQARVADNGESIVPVPEHPKLCIKPQHVQFDSNASQAERDLAHWQMTDIQQRTIDACNMWEQSREMPGKNMGAENFRFISDVNGVMLAARNDGERGLHFVTWAYNHDRSSLEHGHYTTSFSSALEDYATRAGLVPKEQIIDPANAPLLYKALQVMESNYWLTQEHDRQVSELCSQLRRIDHAVADKAEDIQLVPAGLDDQDETIEQEMQGP